MDTELPQKFPFILDRNLAKANCTENRVFTPCDIVVLGNVLIISLPSGFNLADDEVPSDYKDIIPLPSP